MKVAVDFDGVLVDMFGEAWLPRYNAAYNDVLTREQVTNWDWEVHTKPECGKKGIYALRSPDMYANLTPISGAVEGVRKLAEAGHDLFVVTYDSEGFREAKVALLERHFDGLFNHVYVTRDKSQVPMDVLIDDYHLNCVRVKCPSLMFDYPFNRHRRLPERVRRVSGWRAVPAALDEVFSLSSALC